MALAKMLGLQQMIKWLVIGIVLIVLVVIFFWQFGQFFIPLILTGIAVFLLYTQSTQTRKPVSPILMVTLPLGAFMLGYFIQRVSTVALSGVGYSADSTTLVIDQTMTIMFLMFILAIALMFAISRKATAKRRIWR